MSKTIDSKPGSKANPKSKSQRNDNVIDIFTRKPLSESLDNKLIRIAPELDGLEMLYSNSENEDKLYACTHKSTGSKSERPL